MRPAILVELKERTQIYHNQLENELDIVGRCQTLQGYQQVLTKFWGFYKPIEDQLSKRYEWQNLGFDFESRLKAPCLADDIANLKIRVGEAPLLVRCSELPTLTNFAQAFGQMYVMEGATLGGQIIARQLKEWYGVDAQSGCKFFNSYGSSVGPMWKVFQQTLNDYAEATKTHEIIVEAGCETFIKFRNWLML